MKPKTATHHSKQRITERTNISLKNINNLSKHVFKHGSRIRKFTGEFYDYLSSKQIDGNNFSLRVYEDNIYVFDNKLHKLLTVYPVPEQFLPTSNYLNTEASPSIIWIKTPDNKNLYISECGLLTDDIGLATEFRTRQKANNFIKNNHTIELLLKQGCECIII